jgi:hypothetical protein
LEITVPEREIDLATLNASSPPGDLIHAFGLSMGRVANEMGNIHQYVTWLRDRSIRLNTPQLMEQVKTVLGGAYARISASALSTDTIDKYARNLRSLLSCEQLPANFSISNGVDVPCYSFGDAVDGIFFIGKGATNKRIWFSGVVVGIRSPQSTDSYEVFWLGLPPCKRTGAQCTKNPTWESVHSLRSHVDGSLTGTDDAWMDIGKIRTQYDPDKRSEYVEEQTQLPNQPKQPEQPQPKPKVDVSSSSKLRPKRDSTSTKQLEVSPETSSNRHAKKSRSSRSPHSAPATHAPATQTPSVQAPAQFALHKKTFEVCDSVSYAISCLESFDRGDVEHPSVFKQLEARILALARGLAAMYHNSNYLKMVEDTLNELEDYAGPQPACLPYSKKFVEMLEKYGFCVTPRMFSKSEILCIGITMLDTRHHFNRIEQKSGNEQGFRGMAFLDPRVQRVLLRRLQRYGFTNPRFHPECLHFFSSVVINGGGSWLQSSNWEFNLQSRFVMDCDASPFAIAVSDSPGVLEANGLYVASKTKRHDKPVYVQVSLIEFMGVQRRDKDFTPFKTCLQPKAISSVQAYALDSQGLRGEACSPRVLCCTGNESWGIQLLPGFDTDMFLVRFDWESCGEMKANQAECFKRTIFGGNVHTSMQQSSISIKYVAKAARNVIAPAKLNTLHYFSFGTTKYVVRDADAECLQVPEAMGPQAWHGDGPPVYDAAVYTDCGDLKPDAPSCGARKLRYESWKAAQDPANPRCQVVSEADHLSANSWCPFVPRLLKPFLPEHSDILSESWSALGSMFSDTFIETKSQPQTKQGEREETLETAIEPLRVRIPLGCMAPFTFHYDHRGKGDKKSACGKTVPVPIHARPHEYNFCIDPRKFPTVDIEATLEFESTCRSPAAPNDPGSQLQVLECLQTFTRHDPGHDTKIPPYHEYFCSQRDLDDYVKRALREQCQLKNPVRHQCVEVSEWTICLSSEGGNSEKANGVLVAGTIGSSETCVRVIVTAADFDSDCPLFYGSDGRKFKLLGQGEATTCGDFAATFSSNATLSGLLASATHHLSSNWCSATLHHLLCLLDTRFHPNATLSINERNVLVATSDNDCFELLPFYTMLGKLGTSKLMRLYTCKGVGTRIIVPDPCPVLTNWCFLPLPTGAKKVGLGFRAGGSPPDCEVAPNTCSLTTAVTGIDSEGVVSTVNGTPYRLEGPCHLDLIEELPDDHPLRKAMGSIPAEGSWLDGSMHRVMQALSVSFQEAKKLKKIPAEDAASKAASPAQHLNASLANIVKTPKKAASPAKGQAKKLKKIPAEDAASKAASPAQHLNASLTKIAKTPKKAASPAKVRRLARASA